MPEEDFESESGRAIVRIGEDGLAPQRRKPTSRWISCSTGRGDTDRKTLAQFFAGMRVTFSNFSSTRAELLVKGDFIAARTTLADKVTGVPFGPLRPTGGPVKPDLINFFRFDAEVRPAEECVRYGSSGLYKQLGLELAPSSTQAARLTAPQL
jgi:hypothetical protein